MTGKTDGPPSTLSKRVQIKNELGLHARAAAVISNKAQAASSTIWIIKEDEMVNAASIIDILTLACAKGTWITIASDNPADHPVLLDILESVQSGFGE